MEASVTLPYPLTPSLSQPTLMLPLLFPLCSQSTLNTPVSTHLTVLPSFMVKSVSSRLWDPPHSVIQLFTPWTQKTPTKQVLRKSTLSEWMNEWETLYLSFAIQWIVAARLADRATLKWLCYPSQPGKPIFVSKVRTLGHPPPPPPLCIPHRKWDLDQKDHIPVISPHA